MYLEATKYIVMKNKLLLFFLSPLLLFGCGEAGFESDISKNIEIDPISMNITVPAPLVGQFVPETPPTSVSTGQIDITGDDFEDFLSDAEFFKINQISYSLENFPSNSSGDLYVEVSVSISGGQFLPLVATTFEDLQNNSQDIIIYSESNQSNVNSSTIADLEQGLLNGQPFEMRIDATGRDITVQTTSIDFDVIFKYDVTARIQLN